MFSTLTSGLQQCADWLRDWAVTRVVMESTGDYWKAPFWLLEAAGFETWLVNARDVKHLPGRAKTDKIDAVWLCKLAERGMLRPSFVPPLQIRQLTPTDPVPGLLLRMTAPGRRTGSRRSWTRPGSASRW